MRGEAGRGPDRVLITGASAGLGAAMARAYAAPGRSLALLARSAGGLETVAQACRARGARVAVLVCDVRDAAALDDAVSAFEARSGTIDLAIVNAGIFSGRSATETGSGGGAEPASAAADVIAVNLAGAIATIDAVLPGMRRRRAGRIALVSSLAALQPLADAPAYSASKAGLLAYGESLRDLVAKDGVGISLVMPGHIATGQTAIHQGPLPLLMPAAAAALRIKRGLDAGRSTIAFPRRLYWLIRLGRLMPRRVRALALAGQRFTVDAPDLNGR